MDCAEVRRALAARLDGEGETRGTGRHEEHLRGCPGCRAAAALLRRERDLLVASLRTVPARGRPRLRTTHAAAVLLPLLALSLLGLWALYGAAAEGVADRQAAADERLARPVMVRAVGVPLDRVLDDVATQAGVPLRLGEFTGPPPAVHMALARPIALSSLLRLLERFYGLAPRPAGRGYVLE